MPHDSTKTSKLSAMRRNLYWRTILNKPINPTKITKRLNLVRLSKLAKDAKRPPLNPPFWPFIKGFRFGSVGHGYQYGPRDKTVMFLNHINQMDFLGYRPPNGLCEPTEHAKQSVEAAADILVIRCINARLAFNNEISPMEGKGVIDEKDEWGTQFRITADVAEDSKYDAEDEDSGDDFGGCDMAMNTKFMMLKALRRKPRKKEIKRNAKAVRMLSIKFGTATKHKPIPKRDRPSARRQQKQD
ncbi:hypothetical protein B0H63DRAFT_523414 [Podospora didyma]|uniref:Uncharacterized protein n=1 Tax=Podospora didyma TaxID=330526 RepID=A0AAE0U047_9PEZI|nr:hypothetical protein B0H63DRAFT_523414 [Podospora didyma]